MANKASDIRQIERRAILVYHPIVYHHVATGGGPPTTEAHGGELVTGALRLHHHHAGAVEPLESETRRAADQIHVPCVQDLKAKLSKTWLGEP